jgi:uncharacterized protein
MEGEMKGQRIRKPVVSILITLAIVAIGFQIIGPVVGIMVTFPLFEGTFQEYSDALANPMKYPSFKQSLLIMQGCATLFGMIIIPYYFLSKQGRSLKDLFSGPVYGQPAFITIMLVIVFMGVNSMVMQWNQSIDLPFGMDEWAKEIEDKLAEAVEYITRFDSVGHFVLAFVVIAVLPAIGEELVFRGLIQNDFYRATGNAHVAIWISAILFSAIHLQFLGFVPRLLLGAMFGYLYFWSGNLWLAVLAHFVNNGFTVLALYLYQRGSFPINLEDETVTTPWQAVVFSAIFSALLLYAYKNFYNQHPKADIPD